MIMAAGNTVTLVGNVTRDPELRFLNSGAALCNFGVAVNRRWQQDGEWQEEAHFFDVTAWRDLAENIAETVKKGDRVIIDGRLQFRQWEAEDGGNRSKVEVVADDVGPSLRWATAAITKSERRDNESSSRSGGRGGGDSGRRGSGARRGQAPEPAYDPNEEPF